MKYLLLTALFFATTILLVVFPSSNTLAVDTSTTKPCGMVESVFARGSGQALQEGEADKFKELVKQYAGSSTLSSNHYELGTEHIYDADDANHTGYRYPAIPIAGWNNGGYQNAAGAWISSGGANDYGKSVNDGIKELVLYLNQRFDQDGPCKQSRIILAGYSQGAQVMSQAIVDHSDKIKQHIRDRIDYVALLGDPKLYLPEGKTPFMGTPPACRQSTDSEYRISAWRETVPDCKTEAGALGARNPYVTSEFATRIGTWCNKEDPVCDNHYSVFKSEHKGHERYTVEGRIDEAVKRSLFWVSGHLGNTQRIQLQYSIRNNGETVDTTEAATITLPYVTPPLRIELYEPHINRYGTPCYGYIAVDKHQPYGTNEYSHYYPFLVSHPRQSAYGFASTFMSNKCSVQIFSYDSFANIPTFQPVAPPSSDPLEVEKTIASVPLELIHEADYPGRCTHDQNKNNSLAFLRSVATGDGPNPTTDRLYGLDGGTKLCPASANALNELSAARAAIDMYSKTHEWASDWNIYRPKGVYAKASTLRQAKNDTSRTLPPGDFSLSFTMDTYYTEPGRAITLSVKPSNPAVSPNEYSLFMWDFDNDGIVDRTTIKPEILHTFTDVYHGSIRVSALTVDNDTAVAAANMVVHENIVSEFTRASLPGAPQQLALKKQSANTLEITWTPADTRADTWMIQINDSPGTHVRIGDSYKVTITDLDLSLPTTIRVQGVTSDGNMGEAALVGWRPDGTTTGNDEYALGGRGYSTPSSGKNNTSTSAPASTPHNSSDTGSKSVAASTPPSALLPEAKHSKIAGILPPPKDWRAPTLALATGVAIVAGGVITYIIVRRRKIT